MLYGVLIGVGFAAGLLAYLLSRSKLRDWKLAPLMHSGVWGCGIAAGLHLVICAIYPEELVHLTGPDGAPLHAGGIVYNMDVLHRVHIAAGGVATIFLAFRPLLQACWSIDGGGDAH